MRAFRRSAIFISRKSPAALGGQGCSPGPGHYPVHGDVGERTGNGRAAEFGG